ncbi:MAG: hypothetical protein M1834_006801 [Cirrosporium novae-zelandiae]|nr:MAG: hypothetical protein M1834_006801 [Cirrosporium novae-zelandiae]
MASTPDKNGIVDVAQTGFSKAAAYDQYRPSYPPEALEHLLDNLKVVGLAQAKIVDLAAGTGKFTELIAARKEAYHITAVEPHEGMCQELIKKNLTNVTVKAGSATSIPVADQSLDAVIAAQTPLKRSIGLYVQGEPLGSFGTLKTVNIIATHDKSHGTAADTV